MPSLIRLLVSVLAVALTTTSALSTAHAQSSNDRVADPLYYRDDACERYEQLTGSRAPVIAGVRRASRADDHKARDAIARELGHARRDVVAAYVGSSR